MSGVDLLRTPDLVRAFDADGQVPLDDDRRTVRCTVDGARLRVELAGSAPVSRLMLRWHGDLDAVRAVLPAWERSYGDLAWLPGRDERVLPWSFLTLSDAPGTPGGADGTVAAGYGVAVGPGALCWWTADPVGVSLWADVRCGGAPVVLGDRTLRVCDVVSVDGEPGEGAFAVQRRLCGAMSPAPRLPDHPVHGANDWHYALGGSDRRSILALAEFVSACSPNTANRPYLMVDDGWPSGGLGHGPWIGNRRYGHMGELAASLHETGTRPGVWYRPLTPLPEHGDRWRLARGGGAMDPTVPEVRQSVQEQLARFAGWGYRLVKHDFTVWDLTGRWGFQMGGEITDGEWAFADRSRTTAEVFADLYRLIREAAGPAIVMGCNAFGHLVAGHAELQRIGDDASGRSWDRTRRMAVNTLAFRGAQHGAFYAVDADVAPITPALPWRQSVQWLHLLAASGTPTFVSIDPASRTLPVASALRDAFTLAAQPQPLAEPLDWTTSATPARWRLGAREQTYDWHTADGAWPFPD
jgi:alpha-galactosidase